MNQSQYLSLKTKDVVRATGQQNIVHMIGPIPAEFVVKGATLHLMLPTAAQIVQMDKSQPKKEATAPHSVWQVHNSSFIFQELTPNLQRYHILF